MEIKSFYLMQSALFLISYQGRIKKIAEQVGLSKPLNITLARKEMTKNGPIHCVKSVLIRSSFWSVFSRIQSECRKIRTRKNYVFENCSRSDLVFHYYGHTIGIGTAINIKRDRYFTRYVFYAIGKIVSLIKPIFITK